MPIYFRLTQITATWPRPSSDAANSIDKSFAGRKLLIVVVYKTKGGRIYYLRLLEQG